MDVLDLWDVLDVSDEMEDKDKPLILPHGGYRKLHSYRYAKRVYDGTVVCVQACLTIKERVAVNYEIYCI